MKPVGDLNELRRDPDPAACLSNTPLQDVVDIELLADLPEFDVFSAEKERRGAARDLQAGDVGEHIDDLFGQPVAEILVLLVRAHVGERQHGN